MIRLLPSGLFLAAMVFIGLVIILLNDVFGKIDGFIEFSLFYFLFLFVSITRWIFSQVRSVTALKRDKVRMEMLHLKSQVNPHFFFNTLNNLYGLVEKDPKQAQSLILKLSELMRYSIYDGQKEWVSLDEEINYIQNYIDLHRNRYHKKVRVQFEIDTSESKYRIMPLLLILLVENAFKHGVEKLRNDAFVYIVLVAKNDQINFAIANNYDQEDVNDQPAGIGISNLKRRLEIGYKKEFDLEMSNQDEMFQVKLSLYKV